MSKLVFLDFEYCKSKDKRMSVVCVSMLIVTGDIEEKLDVWLFEDEERKAEYAARVEDLISQDYIFVAFAVIAESRGLISVGIDPLRIRWIDLHLNYRMLLNHDHQYMCGKHLIQGKVKHVFPPKPKWERTEEDTKGKSHVAGFNLSGALFKICGVDIDTDHKNKMRDLIIAGGPFSDEEKNAILDYCQSDVKYLPELHRKIYMAFRTKLLRKDRKNLNESLFGFGEYAARSAVMETEGYPIDYEATRNFSDSTRDILFDCQQEITDLFPLEEPFLLNKKGDKFTMKINNLRQWVKQQGHEGWMKTDKGAMSLSLDAFTKFYNFSHTYPKDCLGAQTVRYLKLKQSLNGFMPGSKKSFWDSVGSDKRVRPFMGIFRAQSGRSQPGSTGFIPLKAAWMRSLIVPAKGKTIVAIDYAQQEFLLAALISKDVNMIQAYEAGDPYLHTAKLAGAVPSHGTKAEYPELRDLFKSTTLGIQYGMGAKGLRIKVENDTGQKKTEEECQKLIDLFYKSYPNYYNWTQEIWGQYMQDGYLQLPCGWTMWGDNKNRKSVANFPIQGFGSSIMRKAVSLAQDIKLKVIFTLHDALYIECPTNEVVESLNGLWECMDEAVRYYFKDTNMEQFADCRMDPTVWGPDWDNKATISTDLGDVTPYSIYIDPRAEKEYYQFKKYFEFNEERELKKIL